MIIRAIDQEIPKFRILVVPQTAGSVPQPEGERKGDFTQLGGIG